MLTPFGSIYTNNEDGELDLSNEKRKKTTTTIQFQSISALKAWSPAHSHLLCSFNPLQQLFVLSYAKLLVVIILKYFCTFCQIGFWTQDLPYMKFTAIVVFIAFTNPYVSYVCLLTSSIGICSNIRHSGPHARTFLCSCRNFALFPPAPCNWLCSEPHQIQLTLILRYTCKLLLTQWIPPVRQWARVHENCASA